MTPDERVSVAELDALLARSLFVLMRDSSVSWIILVRIP